MISQLEAAAVNLVAKDKPADVYTEIAIRYVKFIFSNFCYFHLKLFNSTLY